MMNFINNFHNLHDNQFGFSKKFSTSVAVPDVITMIHKELYADNYVLGIFMDLQKAFDTVNYKILLKKIKPLWISWTMLKLV